MNDRWFNFAIGIGIVMFFINGFLLMASTQPDANGQFNPLFADSSSNAFTYSQAKTNSNFVVGTTVGSSSQSPTNEQGLDMIKTDDGGIFSFTKMFDYATTMALGFELLMLKFAAIFAVAAPLFWAFAAIGFFCKTILVAYLGSFALRATLGRIQ